CLRGAALDDLAVDPAGAGAGPAAARPLGAGLLRGRVLRGGVSARGALLAGFVPTGPAPALLTHAALLPATAILTTATAAATTLTVASAPLAVTAPVTVAAPGARRGARTAEVFDLLRVQALAGALVLGQGALGGGGDVEVGEEVVGGRVGLHRLGRLEPQLPGDEGPAREVFPVHEGDRGALLARAAGAAGAVEVGLVVVGAVPVHDVGDVGDVDAARGDVGRDEHVDLPVAEGAQRLLTGALAEVAVQRRGGEAAVGEVARHPVRLALGAHEDDRQAAAAGLQHARHDLDLVELVGAVDDLLDVRLGARLVARVVGADVRGLGHEAARERHDRARHRRREQHRLALRGDGLEQLLDVLEEAEVEHLVSLVEHRGADLGEVQVLLAHEVDE